ncbi:MAG: hypothetical protein GF320_22150, partial [Armatimonadia bacterium]|nr:hypothetical protein [Armatimonadia bacterium]
MTPRAHISPARILLAAALCLLWALPAGANSSGPLDGKTGAPGEGNCTDCHTTFPLDSGDGSFG